MEPIVNVVLPVFAIMLAGYLSGRAGLLGEASSQALNGFVYYIALPALFFVSMARVPVAEVLHGPFLIAFGGGMLATFGIAMLVATFVFPNRTGALSLHGMSAIFSNTGYMGIPLLVIAFGEVGKLPAIISTVVTGVVAMGLITAILEIDLAENHGPLTAVRNALAGVLKSPLVMSAGAGLAYSAVGYPLPQPVETFGDLLGAAAGPAALFAIGLFMVGKSFTAGMGEVGWVVALKLLVQPAITWWLAFGVLQMDTLWAQAAVIQAALPTGALTFVLAQRYGTYIQRATAVILISTVASVVTLSALFIYLGVG
ncbi:MAG: AEC family transporter [Rhodovibrionaceae bacterium]